MIVEFKYFEHGQEKILPVDLKLFSHRVRGWYNDDIAATSELEKLAYENVFISGQIHRFQLTKPDGWKEQIKECQARKKELEAEIRKADPKAILERKLKIVARIMTDNGIDDPRFQDTTVNDDGNFYLDNVNATDLKNFLDQCAYAEIGKNEKKNEIMKSFTKTA